MDNWFLQSLYRDGSADGDETTENEFHMHIDGEPTFISGNVNAESLPLDPAVKLSLRNTQDIFIKTISMEGLGMWTDSKAPSPQEASFKTFAV